MDGLRRGKALVIVILFLLAVVVTRWHSSVHVDVRSLELWKDDIVSLVKKMEQNRFTEIKLTTDMQASIEKLDLVLKQRNALSFLLNEMRKKIGQMQCESKGSDTNQQGGWCKKASTERGGNHLTDIMLVPVLSWFLKGKTVGSFGDGPGAYKREITKLGEVAMYDSYDGAPYCEETSDGLVKFLDLSVPQYGLPVYDYVMSLEVAEHIPRQYEAVYLDNIFRHAKEGIILSWAVPGQIGLDHINNRPLDYVIDVMNKNGFRIDREKSKVLQDGARFDWLKSNTHVYIRYKNMSVEYLRMVT